MSDEEISGALRAGTVASALTPCDERHLTHVALALREIFRDADAALAPDVAAGVLHKGTVLAVFMALRDAVRPFNERLADELAPTLTEKAEVQS